MFKLFLAVQSHRKSFFCVTVASAQLAEQTNWNECVSIDSSQLAEQTNWKECVSIASFQLAAQINWKECVSVASAQLTKQSNCKEYVRVSSAQLAERTNWKECVSIASAQLAERCRPARVKVGGRRASKLSAAVTAGCPFLRGEAGSHSRVSGPGVRCEPGSHVAAPGGAAGGCCPPGGRPSPLPAHPVLPERPDPEFTAAAGCGGG